MQNLAGDVGAYYQVGRQGPSARIRYQILPQLTHGYGGAAIWELQSVEFMRGYTEAGEPDWIKVLSNLALVEMYVPYYDGYELWDIQGLSGFVRASAASPRRSTATPTARRHPPCWSWKTNPPPTTCSACCSNGKATPVTASRKERRR